MATQEIGLVKVNEGPQAAMAAEVEKVLIGGDLSRLTPEQRISYYNAVCHSLNLNPLTKPFAYLNLSGKTVLYAQKDCTEQLRNNHAISLKIPTREVIDGIYVVTASAFRPDGRHDESTGAVPIENLKGEAKANAMMKAETKAKRRVTLSICGLGMLDESEIESFPGAENIDTSGHPVGTQAAADHVAQQKIAQSNAKSSTPQATASVPPGAAGGVDGGGSAPSPELEALIKRCSSREGFNAVCAELCSIIDSSVGVEATDKVWTTALTLHGDPAVKRASWVPVVTYLWNTAQTAKEVAA